METAHAEPNRSPQAGTEAALVVRARTGDGNAIEALIRTHAPRLRRVAWRVVGNHADAEDVVQEALLKACLHLIDYQERAAFSTWLTRIALNEGIGLLRKRRTEPIDLAEGDCPLQNVCRPGLYCQTPEQFVISRELEVIVHHCMHRIHPDYRAVLRLRIFDELSHQEIADRLGLSVAAIKTRLHRARRVLQGMLQRCGAGLPGFNTSRHTAQERERYPMLPLTAAKRSFGQLAH